MFARRIAMVVMGLTLVSTAAFAAAGNKPRGVNAQLSGGSVRRRLSGGVRSLIGDRSREATLPNDRLPVRNVAESYETSWVSLSATAAAY